MWEVAVECILTPHKLHTLSLNAWWKNLPVNEILIKHFSLCEALIWFEVALFRGYLLRKGKVFWDPHL